MADRRQVPVTLSVVSGPGLSHYFPVHPSAHGPPRGPCLAIRREIHQVKQRPLLQAVQPVKQRRFRLPKRRLKRRAILRRIRPKVQVEVEVEIQAETQVPTPVATQSSIHSDEHRGILRATQSRFDFGLRAVVVSSDSTGEDAVHPRWSDECRVPVSGGRAVGSGSIRGRVRCVHSGRVKESSAQGAARRNRFGGAGPTYCYLPQTGHLTSSLVGAAGCSLLSRPLSACL